jgi:hypothetical protein
MTRDNETWVVEEGDKVIQRKVRSGLENFSTWDGLVYSLWVAGYAMRNGGDLKDAKAFFCDFQSIAVRAADELSLPFTRDLISMDLDSIELAFFDRFDAVCDEIRQAAHSHVDDREK